MVRIIVDNGYLQKGFPSLKVLIRRISKYKLDSAIGIDSDYEKTLLVKRMFPEIKIVYPIHYEDDIRDIDVEKTPIDYIGYATINGIRHYSLKWFIKNIPRHKRFMLGFTLRDIPILVREFHAGDTVIVQYNAYYGKDLLGRKKFKSFSQALRNNIQQLFEIIRKHEKIKPLFYV